MSRAAMLAVDGKKIVLTDKTFAQKVANGKTDGVHFTLLQYYDSFMSKNPNNVGYHE